jgi:hypothetical protein
MDTKFKNKRGVIFSRYEVATNDKNITVVNRESNAINELKKLVLYWDEILYLKNYDFSNCFGGFDVNNNEEFKLLYDEGILKPREAVNVSAEYVKRYIPDELFDSMIYEERFDARLLPEIMAISQIKLVEDFLREREIWSIASFSKDLRFRMPEIPSVRTKETMLECELYNSLPIPHKDVPLKKILEFKSQRQSELIEFRKSLESARQSILNSSEPDRQFLIEFEDLNEKFNTVSRLLGEDKIHHTVDVVRTYLNLNPLSTTISILTAALLSESLVIPIATGVMGVSIIGKFISREANCWARVPAELRQYVYLYEAKKHKIISGK